MLLHSLDLLQQELLFVVLKVDLIEFLVNGIKLLLLPSNLFSQALALFVNLDFPFGQFPLLLALFLLPLFDRVLLLILPVLQMQLFFDFVYLGTELVQLFLEDAVFLLDGLYLLVDRVLLLLQLFKLLDSRKHRLKMLEFVYEPSFFGGCTLLMPELIFLALDQFINCITQ